MVIFAHAGLSLPLIECFQSLCAVALERFGQDTLIFFDEAFAGSGVRSDSEGEGGLHKHIVHLQVCI
jgi:hypothetical protein